MTYSKAELGTKLVEYNSKPIPLKAMPLFDSSNCSESKIPSEALEKKLLGTEKYLSAKANFIVFQDWSSESQGMVMGDKNWFDDEQLADELAQLFNQDEILDDQLADELASLEEYLLESQTVLVACPKNMPRWENAWWGERVLRELG